MARSLLSQSSVASSESGVSEELELLSQVYLDELTINHGDSGEVELIFHITPSTGEDKGKQYVCLDLHAILGPHYPSVAPSIRVCQSRGLSDSHVRGIEEGLHYKCQEVLGMPMMYELVEYAKDCLTDNNLPCGKCAICQFNFKDSDHVTKTSCYHYFHVACLSRYVQYYHHQLEEQRLNEAKVDSMLRRKPKQLECPVCREVVGGDETCLKDVSHHQLSSSSAAGGDQQEEGEGQEVIQLTDDIRAWQLEMARLLWKQRERGGVIDISEDRDVLDENWVSAGQTNDDIQQDRQQDRKEMDQQQDREIVGQDKHSAIQKGDRHKVAQDKPRVDQTQDRQTGQDKQLQDCPKDKDDVSSAQRRTEKTKSTDYHRHKAKDERTSAHFTRHKQLEHKGPKDYHSSNHHGNKKRWHYHPPRGPTDRVQRGHEQYQGYQRPRNRNRKQQPGAKDGCHGNIEEDGPPTQIC